MKIRELKSLVKEKLASGMTKQETFDFIASLNQIRIHDVANTVRDFASLVFKKKYKKINLLLISFVVLAGIIQGIASVLFPEKLITETLPADIFLISTYAAIAFGAYVHYKFSYSAAVLLSFVSIYMSVNNVLLSLDNLESILYYSSIGIIGIVIIGLSGFLYSKFFRGYDIISNENKEDSLKETYVFKEEK